MCSQNGGRGGRVHGRRWSAAGLTAGCEPASARRVRASVKPNDVQNATVCQYCSYAFQEGWTKLAEYDEVYQQALAEMRREAGERTHGFYDDWDDLRDQVTPG